MGIISVEQMNELYWLGRYMERVYTTLHLYFKSYDEMIDQKLDSYQDFCRKVEIPDIYGSPEAFRERYPFDETDPNSIISNLKRAYDNAIILREEIGSETLAFVQLAIFSIQKAKLSEAPLIQMMAVMDHIMAFWGIADDEIDSEQVRNILKAGKRVERLDMYARLGANREKLLRELHRLIPRVERSGIGYDASGLRLLDDLITAENIDCYRVIETVENLVEV